MCASECDDRSYDAIYQAFDSPVMQKVRREAYGRDIGQHSWVTAEEFDEDIPRLKLSHASRLLDLGCGPCGPLLFILGRIGCHGSGVDVSAQAIATGRARAAALGLEALVSLREADLNRPIPFAAGAFDAVVSFDVVLHLRDRVSLFREAARVLKPGGRFLFTDAGVMTGSITDEELQQRAFHGPIQLVPPGFNEQTVQGVGLRLIECMDRTANLLKNATGRLRARINHRAELAQLEGAEYYEGQQRYLETVINLAQRRSIARVVYLAESCSG